METLPAVAVRLLVVLVALLVRLVLVVVVEHRGVEQGDLIVTERGKMESKLVKISQQY